MISAIQNRGRNYRVNVPDALEFYCVEPVSEAVDRIFLFFRRRGEPIEAVLARARTTHPTNEILRPVIGERDEDTADFGIDPAHAGEVHFDVQWEDNKKSTIIDGKKYYALVNFTLRPEDRDRLLLEEEPGPAAGAAPAAEPPPGADRRDSVRVAGEDSGAPRRPLPAGTTFLSADMGRLAAMWHEVPAPVRAAILTIAEAARGRGGGDA
jgi:hypothetical protein